MKTKIVQFEEGFREKPYYCTEGYPTIGWGRVIGKKGDQLPSLRTTRSIEDKLLQSRLDKIEVEISRHSTLSQAWAVCNEPRRAILVSMVYQLGLNGTANFKKCIAAITEKNWSEASKQMLDSRAARQTPNRFNRQANVMLTGSIRGVYN